MLRILLIVLVALWASGAQASDTWGKNCAHTGADAPATPSNPVDVIGAGEHAGGLPKLACLGWGTTTVSGSKVLTVRADSVLFTLIDDVAGTSATATAMIEKCVCDTTIARNTNTCIDILDTALTGTEGAPGTQNASVRAGPGCYRVTTVAGVAGDHPILTAEAEE
jgi:hypothetical protein